MRYTNQPQTAKYKFTNGLHVMCFKSKDGTVPPQPVFFQGKWRILRGDGIETNDQYTSKAKALKAINKEYDMYEQFMGALLK